MNAPLYPRFLAPRVLAALADTPVVLLSGPRQVGKTTLVRQLADPARRYLTLDDDLTRLAAREDPVGFVRGIDRAIIDEVQRAPDLLLAIKRAVDEDRIKCAVYGSLAARLAGVPARVNAVAGMGYVFTSFDAKARLILQNPDDVALFERAGLVDKAHIRLIPGSGVDCSRFTARSSVVRDRAKPLRVLLAARLLWDKGVACPRP